MSTDSRRAVRASRRVTGGVGFALVAASVATAAPAEARDHVVKPGDTVSHLALRYGTTTKAIIAANRLNRSALIRIGETLTIPEPPSAAPTPAPTPAPAPAPTTVRYTVRSGDTVSHIAARYHTTIAAVIAANGLDSRAFIRAGQTLTIPATTAAQPVTSGLVDSTFNGRTYPAATVSSANQNKATLLAIGVPTRAQMQELVITTARQYGVDPALAQAIAYQESGFNHASVSPANAIGCMQVIPSSGQWASDLIGRDLNLLDPADNVTAGVVILRQLLRSAGDTPTAIAGYYQGLSSVRRNGMFADTRRYVANVQTLTSRFA
jgi:soluble lytic murein transglycosylase-like protein